VTNELRVLYEFVSGERELSNIEAIA